MTNSPQHAAAARLASALGQMTSGVVEGQRGRDEELFALEPTEMAQQVHINVSGQAGRKRVTIEQVVDWPYPFMMVVSQSQNDSSLQTPHFNCGIVLKSDDYVMIDASVRDWIENDARLITGAKVKITVVAPEAPKMVPYDAVVHLTFMGFAAPSEDDTTPTQAS